MSYPKEIKDLPDIWQMIYSIKEPMEFIDMLCANAYLAGQFGNKHPVSEVRTVFLTWLEKREKKEGRS